MITFLYGLLVGFVLSNVLAYILEVANEQHNR